MKIGDKIKQARETAGMTQVELSEKSGIRQEHISRLENNKFDPNWKTIIYIADALGVEIAELVTVEE